MRRLPRLVPLGLAVLVLATGTAATFGSAAGARRAERERLALGDALLGRGVTRIYTDYWTCHDLVFRTRERIVCAVVDDDLEPGYDRYPAYRAMVEADPDAAYAVPLGSPQAAALDRALSNPCAAGRTRREVVHGYLVVRPARPMTRPPRPSCA